jgi:pimeloyl-ACP methyl ester carboxylesterase
MEVVLVHGGASPETTWVGLEPLSARWTVTAVRRRGHDFDLDAAQLEPLLATRPHLVAHSYGALGASIATARAPDRVRSLTLIEPPLAHFVTDDEEVAAFVALGDEFLTRGLDMDPVRLREFLRIAGSPVDDGPLPARVVEAVRRSRGGRLVSEAHPDLHAIRAGGVPCLVASGAHTPAVDRTCDVVADQLGAERVVKPGAGHFVARAPGFCAALEDFLVRVGG